MSNPATMTRATVAVRIYDYLPGDAHLGHNRGFCESYCHEEEVKATAWASYGPSVQEGGGLCLIHDLCADCAAKLAEKAVIL